MFLWLWCRRAFFVFFFLWFIKTNVTLVQKLPVVHYRYSRKSVLHIQTLFPNHMMYTERSPGPAKKILEHMVRKENYCCHQQCHEQGYTHRVFCLW